MINFLSEEIRRNPYPLYAEARSRSPLLFDEQTRLWSVSDYDGVKRVLNDHEAFSSKAGPAEWMIFMDPPRHGKLHALVSKAFTPRSIANLEVRIRALSRELLGNKIKQGEMDLAEDFSVQLPLVVIAEMLGVPAEDRPRFKRWNDIILNMSYTIPGGRQAEGAFDDFVAVTNEMGSYLTVLVEQRRAAPQDDLLTRLIEAEVDGERLAPYEVLGFFQLLLLAGSETTTNLINNAFLCFIEHPDELAPLRARPELLGSTIEEVLRYRSPVQWMIRVTRRELEFAGKMIPARAVVLAMIGSANRDPRQFRDAETFDLGRDPNPQIAFGHGAHFCLGAPLSRLEARIALTELLEGMQHFELASDRPWEPRRALHVHGPSRLPIRFEPRQRAATA